jgi:3D (Asp-Asp-Asp) domain-containing protein
MYWGLITSILPTQLNNINNNFNQTKAIKPNKISLSVSTKPVIPTAKQTTIVTQTPVITVKPTVNVTLSSRAEPKELIYKSDKMIFKVSAYELSVASCGKSRSNPNFGLTCTGFNLANKSRIQAMTIAADKRILPLGTKVSIEFQGIAIKYNGIYTVRDTGGAIKGHKLDLFMGDGTYRECMDFGVQIGNVKVIQ